MSKTIDIQKLTSELAGKLAEVMTSEEFGFTEDDIRDYTALEVNPYHSEFTDDDMIRVEVRAELSYNGLMTLADALDDVIQKYDKDAYFDAEDPGIINAYLTNKVNECINIREALNQIDMDTYCQYNLVGAYDYCNLTTEHKKHIAEMLTESATAEEISNYLVEAGFGDLLKGIGNVAKAVGKTAVGAAKNFAKQFLDDNPLVDNIVKKVKGLGSSFKSAYEDITFIDSISTDKGFNDVKSRVEKIKVEKAEGAGETKDENIQEYVEDNGLKLETTLALPDAIFKRDIDTIYYIGKVGNKYYYLDQKGKTVYINNGEFDKNATIAELNKVHDDLVKQQDQAADGKVQAIAVAEAIDNQELEEDIKDDINDTSTYTYLFPELDSSDLNALKAYNLTFLGKNHGAYGDEDNFVVSGTKANLIKYGREYLGDYEPHPDYLYGEDEFAEEVEDRINETFGNDAGPFRWTGCWFENNKIIFSVEDKYTDEFEVEVPVDFRKIRKPSDLKDKYAPTVAAKMIAYIKYAFGDNTEPIEEDYDGWKIVNTKSVPDFDGFMTDYTWYEKDGHHIFMLGDQEITEPDEGYADWEADSEEAAREWFDSYNGFEDEDDKSFDDDYTF